MALTAAEQRERKVRLRGMGAIYWPPHHLWILNTRTTGFAGPNRMMGLTRYGWRTLAGTYGAAAQTYYDRFGPKGPTHT